MTEEIQQIKVSIIKDGRKTSPERLKYERLIAESDFKQDDEPENITRTQDLNRIGWCKIFHKIFYPSGHWDRVRMVKTGVSGDAQHWLDVRESYNKGRTIVIDGQAYTPGDILESSFDPTKTLDEMMNFKGLNSKNKGMAGQVCAIKYDGDHKVIFTNDLWHNGAVPEEFKAVLPNNARFLEI